MYSKYIKQKKTYIYLDLEYIFMEEMSFPAKIMKPMRITIPDAVKEGLGLNPGDLLQVTVKKINPVQAATKSKQI